MGNVIELPGVTDKDSSVAQVLTMATDANLTDAIVLGYDADGEFYFRSTKADGGDVLWLLQLAIHKLMLIGNRNALEETRV